MIDACINNCVLFRKDLEKAEVCPICNESRWKPTGKNVSQKILRYFPLKDRLKRLYASRHTSLEMQWHERDRVKEEGVLRHPADGSTWKNLDDRYPNFTVEPRNVRLGLASYGFNPFGEMSLSYSMWPVVPTAYNLPPWLCMKKEYLMLTLLIPGPISHEDSEMYARRDVLGVCRDCKVSLGPSIPRSSLGVAQTLDRGSSNSSSQTDPLVAEMRAQMDAQQAELQGMRQQIAFLSQLHNQPLTTPQPPPASQPGGTDQQTPGSTPDSTPGSMDFLRDRPYGSGGMSGSASGSGGRGRGSGFRSSGNLFGRGNSTIDKFYRKKNYELIFSPF